MESKEVLTAYMEIVIEELSTWVQQAHNIVNKFSTVASILRLTAYRLQLIDNSIADLQNRIHILFKAYRDLEKEYELKPLSVQYGLEFSEKVKEMDEIIEDIKQVVDQYEFFIEKSKEEKIDIDAYISITNQKSIRLLQNLTVENLLDILEKGRLIGIQPK